jgi:hypothetical protein
MTQVHYFLCRDKDNYVRIGIQGSRIVAQCTFRRYYDHVEYIGPFVDVVYTDIDKYEGIGGRRFLGFTVLTAKYIYQLRSTKKDGDYFAYLREAHVRLQRSVEESWKRKEERRKAKEAKANAGVKQNIQ